jgi:hypothetical protein
VLTIRPSAELACTDCVKELAAEGGGSGPVLLVPPGLTDAALLRVLGERYTRYRVWRLSFAGVGSFRRAFNGFANRTAAVEFDKRMEHINTFFCCRWGAGNGCMHQALASPPRRPPAVQLAQLRSAESCPPCCLTGQPATLLQAGFRHAALCRAVGCQRVSA